MGTTVGPAFSKALSSKFGASNVASEGVKYPADISGAFSGGTNPSGSPGATKMTQMAKAVLQRCPNTKIVLSGYSQGAEQVHGALFAKNLGEDGARIAAAVTYGDPLKNYQQFGPGTWGSLPAERTLVFCNQGDGVCGGAFSISAAHLSYTSNGDIAKGVSFVVKTLEALGNDPLKPAPPPAARRLVPCLVVLEEPVQRVLVEQKVLLQRTADYPKEIRGHRRSKDRPYLNYRQYLHYYKSL